MSNDENWQDLALFEDMDEFPETVKKGKSYNKVRKRKWREIETVKEQRRLRRELLDLEQYSF